MQLKCNDALLEGTLEALHSSPHAAVRLLGEHVKMPSEPMAPFQKGSRISAASVRSATHPMSLWFMLFSNVPMLSVSMLHHPLRRSPVIEASDLLQTPLTNLKI